MRSAAPTQRDDRSRHRDRTADRPPDRSIRRAGSGGPWGLGQRSRSRRRTRARWRVRLRGGVRGPHRALRDHIGTRFTPRVDGEPASPGSGQGAPTPVRWTVSPTADCTEAVATGVVTTSPGLRRRRQGRRHGAGTCTRSTSTSSQQATRRSEVGRTRTAPDEPEPPTRCGSRRSCANYTWWPLRHLRGDRRARRPRLRPAPGRLLLRVRQRRRPVRPGRADRRARPPAGPRDRLARGLPDAAGAVPGGPRPARGAPAAPVHHRLRRSRDLEQRVVRRSREPQRAG